MNATLTIGPRTYTGNDLRTLPADITTLGDTDNERSALAFCRDWLAGVEQFVISTSGSTGDPKPIVLRREQMLASALATGEALDLLAGMSALVCLPVRYIAGQMMLVRGLVLGLSITVVEPASDPLSNLAIDTQFDFTALVPLQLQTLLDGPRTYHERLNAMHTILVGGAPVNAALEERIQTLSAPVYHTYGMTETATHIALRRLNSPNASTDFHPLPGVEIDIDPRGCLRIKAPMTLNQWLQTNDLVKLSAPQPPAPSPQSPPPTFRWLGRWDNVVNTGGVKVQIEKVEAAVGSIWRALGLAERRYFVAGLPDKRLGEAVTLVIEGEPMDAGDQTTLQSALAANLDLYEAPRRVIYIPTFATTDTGKIDRRSSLGSKDVPPLADV